MKWIQQLTALCKKFRLYKTEAKNSNLRNENVFSFTNHVNGPLLNQHITMLGHKLHTQYATIFQYNKSTTKDDISQHHVLFVCGIGDAHV